MNDGLTQLERQRLRKVIRKVVTNFKGMNFLVLDVAKYITGENLVIFQALYGRNDVYALPVRIFLNEFKIK